MQLFFDESYLSLSDDDLILKVRDNDSSAYGALFERYKNNIKRIVDKYSALLDKEDLLQEASISFYYAIQFFDFQSASFSTFSSVCVERSIISAVNKTNAKKRIPTELIVPLGDEVVSESDDPENVVLQKEAHALVSEQIVNKLSEFELLVLKSYLATGSYDDTATELSVSRKSVDNALSRVRRKLDSLK